MNRSLILLALALGLVACQTPEDPDVTTQTATLKNVVAEGEECFLLATGSGGDLVLMGTPDACEDGDGLEGQVVTLQQKPTMIDVPLGETTTQQMVPMVIGVEPVE
ncbi:MAG: hypothetical protein AAGI52_01685 [Bacteroidota bacterium]